MLLQQYSFDAIVETFSLVPTGVIEVTEGGRQVAVVNVRGFVTVAVAIPLRPDLIVATVAGRFRRTTTCQLINAHTRSIRM